MGYHWRRLVYLLRLVQPQFAACRGVRPEYALPVYLRDKVALTIEEQRAR